MAKCPNCGNYVPDNSPACPSCGAALKAANFANPQNQQPGFGYGTQTVEPVETGGLMALSIIAILFCTIPGVVSLVYTLGVNKAVSFEEQQKKIKLAKIWGIVAIVIGVILVTLRVSLMNNQ